MDDTPPPAYPGQGQRALWIAAVQRAVDDIAGEPFGSMEYRDAAAFFTAGGEWGLSRSTIAGHIDLHPDDLERCGRRCIATRRIAEGLPVEIIETQAAVPQQVPLPRLQAIPAPEKQQGAERLKRDRNWWISKFMAHNVA